MHHEHRYHTELAWVGDTGVGYEAYGRAHTVTASPAEGALQLTSDPAFRGDPALLNPEQLLVAAASSCQLLSFLAVAARARLEVVAYRDEATATMRTDRQPAALERIELRPAITLRGDAGEARLLRLVELAHRECYIANSLRTPVSVEPTFVRI